jgi:hypothetical protein
MINIIIAHYNENLEWVQKLTNHNINNIYIYSKYNNNQNNTGLRQKNLIEYFEKEEYYLSLNPKVIYHKIPNLGKESGTYLKYCYDYYDNLSESTIFLQGEPHANIDTINHWIEYLKKHEFTPNITIATIFSDMSDGRMPLWYGPCEMSQYNCFTWMRTYVDPILYPYNIKIYYGACFGVSKYRILSRSRDYYLNLMEKEFNTINPEAAHFAERMWFYIFNCHKIE